jgi:hypothetical protein
VKLTRNPGRLGRIMKTPLKPINRMVDNISEHLAEMRKESEVLMQTKIHEILLKNRELKRELSTVLEELKGARERVDGMSNPLLSSALPSLTLSPPSTRNKSPSLKESARSGREESEQARVNSSDW